MYPWPLNTLCEILADVIVGDHFLLELIIDNDTANLAKNVGQFSASKIVRHSIFVEMDIILYFE